MSDCLSRLVTALAVETERWGRIENGDTGMQTKPPEIGHLRRFDGEQSYLCSYRVEIGKPWLDETTTYTVTVTEDVRRGR